MWAGTTTCARLVVTNHWIQQSVLTIMLFVICFVNIQTPIDPKYILTVTDFNRDAKAH
jgi:hypothetical protein